VLIAAIAMKLRAQSAELSGPSGGSGIIEGTRVDIAAQISARVEQLFVKKGQTVKQGEPLVKLDCADVRAAIAEAEARVAMAEAQVMGASASKIAARRSTGAVWAQAVAAKTRGDAIDTRRATAVRNVQRLANVGDGVAIATLDQTQSEASSLALEQKAALETAKATFAQASVAAAQGTAAQAGEAAAIAAVNAAKAGLARAQLLQRECELRAPRDGVIEELYLEVGEVAGRGTPILRLIDLHEVKIVFYLPNAELSVLGQGDMARVVVDAYPKEQFEGRITAVSMEAAFTPRNIQTRSDRDRLVYPIEVTLKNPGYRLRPGMPAEVRLHRGR
jgi:HlyD family secretion protein